LKLCLFFNVIFNPFYIGPYEGYFCVCLGCHNIHLHYKRLSNLPFLVPREYKNTLFYFKCEIKNKQPFENMWSKYIKEKFYLYIACFWIKNSNFGRFVFQICQQKKERKTHKNKDDKRVLCSCKYKARHA
jgi:hypothetical protein